MLKTNQSLKVKTVSGKKYREPAFFQSLCVFFAVFIVSLVLFNLIIPERDGKGAIVGLLCVVLSAVPFAMTVGSIKPICVLGEDRVYFFYCEVVKFNNSSDVSKSIGVTNGSFLYSDIRKIDYLPAKCTAPNGVRYSRITPSRIVVYGEEFSVTIFAYRSLIKRIAEKSKDQTLTIENGENERIVSEKPNGLWGDIIVAFENRAFETVWDSEITVEYCTYDRDGDMIDLILRKNGTTVCFNIDQNSVYVCHPQNNKDETLPLAQFVNTEALFSYMRNCADLLL
ncbi:MAG: hypothetical protein ACI3YH_09190 [Eubacteriales bacterium]